MQEATRHRIGFCVDDVGLVGGVAETVVLLAEAGRLSGASCVTNAAAWLAEGAALAAASRGFGSFELGLHLNLTEGRPLSADLARVWPTLPGLKDLIVSAHVGTLPIAALASEWRAQYDAFTDVVGRLPAHVDGHQHVHHLPRIRDLVLGSLVAHDKSVRPAVRNTGRVIGPGHAFKRLLIESTGGRTLQRQLQAQQLRRNSALLGVYDFRAENYRHLVRGWLAAAPERGSLVFCHPRQGPAGEGDPIAAARGREATYLASAAFADDLAEAGFTVGSTWQSSSDD